jgi:hypothetical protein
MVNAINEMAGQFGIPAIEFADENGKRVAGWRVPQPKSVRVKVRKIGGRHMFIQAGDKVRWIRLEDNGEVYPEGEGVIKQVTKNDAGIHIVMENRQCFSAGSEGWGWHREFEVVK